MFVSTRLESSALRIKREHLLVLRGNGQTKSDVRSFYDFGSKGAAIQLGNLSQS